MLGSAARVAARAGAQADSDVTAWVPDVPPWRVAGALGCSLALQLPGRAANCGERAAAEGMGAGGNGWPSG